MSSRISFIAALAFISSVASAQNPAWPNPDATPETLRDPANWPDDPNYGYDVEGDGESCIPGGRCWTNEAGGQWNLWSWIPPQATEADREAAIGAGGWADMAWTVTTGSPEVLIAVLDSGINWDERDLQHKFYINAAELDKDGLDERCRPLLPEGHEGDRMDVDGDGVLSMRDYFVGMTAEERRAREMAIDADGNQNGVAEPGDLITICSDGIDDDENGYIDDISGWDFHSDDNDPMDDTRFGHGTGEARWSAAEANNGMGRAGWCPECQVLMVRTGDSFIVDVQDFGQSVVYAVDAGADIIQEALGSMNASTYMRRALDYAYEEDVLVVASAADENSYHHNVPGTANHTLYVHANRFAGNTPQNADSFVAFNNCTNYGPQLALSAPGTGCSSEATGVTAGIAGLVLAAARDRGRPGGPLDPPLSAEEFRQVLMMTPDDIFVPESDPEHPEYDAQLYRSREGWDQRFGYGRINAYRAVVAVRDGDIPPEVDLVTPRWFDVIYPERTPEIAIEGHIDARRAERYDYVIEWARGVEPEADEFETLASEEGRTEALTGELLRWDLSEVTIENDAEIGNHNRFAVTLRVRVIAHYEDGTEVRGEQRRSYSIVRGELPLDGFPRAVGTFDEADTLHGASGEGSSKLADIAGDESLEIVYADSDGFLHVLDHTGAEIDGFPVQLGQLRGFREEDAYPLGNSEAYRSGRVRSDDIASAVLSATAIADLNGDGSLDIVVANMEGSVYAVNADGTIHDGFPVTVAEVPSSDPLRGGPANRDSIVEQGIFASPAIGDLTGDGSLEIVVGAFDGNVYAWSADGTPAPGFPVELTAPELWMDPADAQPSRIMTSPALGDANGDGILDIAVGSNEYGDDSGTGAFHLLHGDGTLHEGGAEHENWPVRIASLELFPMVGRGTPSAAVMADVDDDGRVEVIVSGTGGPTWVLSGIQPARDPGRDPQRIATLSGRGVLTTIPRRDAPLLNTFANGSVADFDGNGIPDFATGGAGLGLALSLGGGYQNTPFAHQLGAWTMLPEPGAERAVGRSLPGFPVEIEDYLFFMNPTAADVNGDGFPEMIVGSGGYWLHAVDGCGREAEGWPKFMGGWIISSPALGDIDGDGLLEVVSATRQGGLFAFDTEGSAGGVVSWPTWRHDNRNTGNYETPLDYGVLVNAAGEQLECPIPEVPDAGVPDGGLDGGTDAGMDAGMSEDEDSGCGCASVKPGNMKFGALVLLMMLGLVTRRNRRLRR